MNQSINPFFSMNCMNEMDGKDDCKKMYDYNDVNSGKFLLGYAYVPYQQLCQTYDYAKALERGTLFPELDKPMNVYGKEFNS